MRIIKIESCDVCPSRDHRGAFGSPAYVPVCRKMSKTLPYTITATMSGRCMAEGTDVIPDWCPLDKLESEGETHD